MSAKVDALYEQDGFLEESPAALALIGLFDYLPGVIFYAKDRQSRYRAANQAMLTAKNLRLPEELLGRSDHDFHPRVLADAYVAEDKRVMKLSGPLPNQIWFIIDRSGRPGWYNSSKTPLTNQAGKVIGLAGVRYAIQTPEDRQRQFRAIAPVIQYLEQHYTEQVSMKQMAELAGISSTHLNRQFDQIFGMSPTRFLHSLRIEKARQLLVHSKANVGEIALETGYYDQSHFTRHFRALTQLSPRAFRQRFQETGEL